MEAERAALAAKQEELLAAEEQLSALRSELTRRVDVEAARAAQLETELSMARESAAHAVAEAVERERDEKQRLVDEWAAKTEELERKVSERMGVKSLKDGKGKDAFDMFSQMEKQNADRKEKETEAKFKAEVDAANKKVTAAKKE